MESRSSFSDVLGQVARRWRTRLNARLRDLGLTQARWQALLELQRNPGMTQRDLASGLGIESPTLVRLLDTLEQQDLIERRPCADDRRAKRVFLTAAAQPLLGEIRAIADAMRDEVLKDLPAGDLETTRGVLAHIADRLEAM